jgi:hypothetical protein
LSNRRFGTIFHRTDEARSITRRPPTREAIMAYAARPTDFHGAAPYKAAATVPAVVAPTPPRNGFWSRMLDAILDSRQRDAERAVEQYVARRGKLTDSMEREIGDRFVNGR